MRNRCMPPRRSSTWRPARWQEHCDAKYGSYLMCAATMCSATGYEVSGTHRDACRERPLEVVARTCDDGWFRHSVQARCCCRCGATDSGPRRPDRRGAPGRSGPRRSHGLHTPTREVRPWPRSRPMLSPVGGDAHFCSLFRLSEHNNPLQRLLSLISASPGSDRYLSETGSRASRGTASIVISPELPIILRSERKIRSLAITAHT